MAHAVSRGRSPRRTPRGESKSAAGATPQTQLMRSRAQAPREPPRSSGGVELSLRGIEGRCLLTAPKRCGVKMLFQMPNGVPLRSVPGGVSEEWRCAGCGTHLRGTELDLPSFCVFCK